jgi:cold shock CspA family protein
MSVLTFSERWECVVWFQIRFGDIQTDGNRKDVLKKISKIQGQRAN